MTGHVWPSGGTDTQPGLHWIINELFRDSAARLGWLVPPPGKEERGNLEVFYLLCIPIPRTEAQIWSQNPEYLLPVCIICGPVLNRVGSDDEKFCAARNDFKMPTKRDVDNGRGRVSV